LKPLLETDLPLILFSTAPRSAMAEGIAMKDIMENHGVHGYMDLANVLRRARRNFAFVCGGMEDERAFDTISAFARAARTRKALGESRIGVAGHTFDGMGDLGLDPTFAGMRLGIDVEHLPLHRIAEHVRGVSEKQVREESNRDRDRFTVEGNVDDETLDESNRLYLALRETVRERSLDGFTMHFQAILENRDIRTPPFLAISKLQEEGIGYAGEGDVLGAAANVMLHGLCGESLFTEPFCPDFGGGRLLMGHMGESNPRFGRETTLRRKSFQFGDALDPVVTDVDMNPGLVTFLNLGIVAEQGLQMIAFRGEMCERLPADRDIDMPYFHVKPERSLEELLTRYGYAGGTHHMAMARGDRVGDVEKLALWLDSDFIVL
jgi:L-arabinose isomerase